ncbi:tRNA (adenosine(37)-N6)-threonylcarbamoyltransferase complex dimerization subunit type 1 TsaB [Tunturiibacter gelidiferens]|uniref:tRNA (adenosine(37)-N6)-threonylcarbamoyltransferase complex dimerization subunit type 1 TsaB n=1 Tax=Tunturiibacter gelidiferens TaxID=3069689 RepID=UPI003D9BB8B9
MGQSGLRLDHLGVAVKSIAGARGFYEALGLVVSHEETVEHEQVKTAMLPLGESRIELLEATEADSTIGRFLAKRGEGLHHIAVHVDGIDAMFARLTKQGVKLASDAVRVGAGGIAISLCIRPARGRATGDCWRRCRAAGGSGVMRFLMIHTAGGEGSVALADSEMAPAIVAAEVLPGRSSSELLVPTVRRLMAASGWLSSELAAVVVVHGPGSFTGVRVGVSAAKGLSEAWAVPLIALSRLALLAGAVDGGEQMVHAVLDAGRGSFITGSIWGRDACGRPW